jgi:hypothetical protein
VIIGKFGFTLPGGCDCVGAAETVTTGGGRGLSDVAEVPVETPIDIAAKRAAALATTKRLFDLLIILMLCPFKRAFGPIRKSAVIAAPPFHGATPG